MLWRSGGGCCSHSNWRSARPLSEATKSRSQLNFVVVGGGPTGVELAGTLAEIARQVLANEFHSIDPKRTRIVLLEGGPRVLPAYPEDLSRSAEEQLRQPRCGGTHLRDGHTELSRDRSIWEKPSSRRRDSLGGRSCGIAAGEKIGSTCGSRRTRPGKS